MKMTEREIRDYVRIKVGCNGSLCWPCGHGFAIEWITKAWLKERIELETSVKTLLEWLPIYSPSSAGYQRVEAVKAALQENKAPKPVKE